MPAWAPFLLALMTAAFVWNFYKGLKTGVTRSRYREVRKSDEPAFFKFCMIINVLGVVLMSLGLILSLVSFI